MDIVKKDPRKIFSSRLLVLLFFLSGCSALIYETLWQRKMILVFGASAPATTAILTAFFCGIAFGSYFGGRLLKRINNTLAFYGWVELWIAVWALAVPVLLAATDQVYLHLFQGSEAGPLLSLFYRFVLSIIVVLPATLGMGATIPAMNRLLVEQGCGVGRGVALAYGINTIGAVLGCLATGFVLIRELGVQTSLYLAGCVNGVVVLITLSNAWPSRDSAVQATGSGTRESQNGMEPFPSPKTLVIIYFFAGTLALGYEILWFRILAIYTTNSLITFTLLLSTYLLGFSTGSILLFPLLARRVKGLTVFVVSNLGTALTILATLPVVYSFPAMKRVFIDIPAKREALTPAMLTGVEASFSLAMVFLPTVFMGLAYPALCQVLIPRKESTAEQSGRYYFIGTLGSMSGVVLLGFFLIPLLGLVGSLGSLCCASCLLAGLTLLAGRDDPIRGRFVWVACSALLAVGAVIYGVHGHPFLKNSHVIFRDGNWIVPARSDSSRATTLLLYKAGRSGTVMAKRSTRSGSKSSWTTLYVDDQAVAASSLSNRIDSKMLAHLPLLLHPDPKRALTVGFGSGGTSRSMTLHEIETDCAEIEPEVVRAASLFFHQNTNALRQPSFRLILNDARNHLHITDERYDVISTDVTNLQYKQNGNLYTREYFVLMKSRLASGGIACAWTPHVQLSEAEFKILLHTFADVFEHPSVWTMNHDFTTFSIFVATPGRLEIDLDRLREGFDNSSISADLKDVNITHPFQFVHFLLLDEDGVRDYVGEVPVHTDDRPILEFFTAFGFHQYSQLGDNNLLDALPFRPVDFRRFVVNLQEEESDLFDKYGRVSQLWSEVLGRYFSIDRYATSATELKKVDDAIQHGKVALEHLPATPSLRNIMHRLVAYRKTLLSQLPAKEVRRFFDERQQRTQE